MLASPKILLHRGLLHTEHFYCFFLIKQKYTNFVEYISMDNDIFKPRRNSRMNLENVYFWTDTIKD